MQDAIDSDIDAALENGFLPPDPEALESAIRVTRVTALIPVQQDTVDGMLLEVATSFHQLVSLLLPGAINLSMAKGFGDVLRAATHVRTIGSLLTFLNRDARHNAQPAQDTSRESIQDLYGDWLELIFAVSRSNSQPPWHLSRNDYVSRTAGKLGMTLSTLHETPRMSIEPSHPTLLRFHDLRDLDQAETPEEAARELVWCAASALCLVACTAPDYRLDDAPRGSPVA